MKNMKKGFTLIELLAIIVILAVIAVITVPIILNIIENAKKGAATNSALGYKDAIQKYYASKLFDDNGFKLQGEFDIDNNGAISNDLENHPIAFSGTIPSGGYATIENGKLISGCVQINEYAVRFENGAVSTTKKENCTEAPLIVEEFPNVTDSNPGIICGNSDAEDYDNSSVCYIYSVEDLVALSSMVSSGKDFSGKTVMLMNGLDIEEDKSYTNPNSNSFGDINGDSTTSSTLKSELTSGKGFSPIGNSPNAFRGTFEGNAHTIKNIYINISDTSHTGLFGYNEGTIRGLKVIDGNVTGNAAVGIIVGYNEGNVTSVIGSGTVHSYDRASIIAGANFGGTVEGIASGDIYTTVACNVDVSYAGGIVGYQKDGTVNGIYKTGNIHQVTCYGNGRTIGYYEPTLKGTLNTIAGNTIKLNNSTYTHSESKEYEYGYDMDPSGLDNIAAAETVLDTYIAGDNNNDGYYYDNDEDGELTIYKLSDKPLTRTMPGEGTQASPYIINNYAQLKQVTYDLTKYYKLNADIDLTGKNQIMIGSSIHPFTGTFDGNTHTISGINIIGHMYNGLFGYNSGTIKGLKVNGNVSGFMKLGVLAGENTGTITSVMATGNVDGFKQVGVIVGVNNGTNALVEGVANGNLNTTVPCGRDIAYAGGLVGYSYDGTTKGLYQSGSITHVDCYDNGRTIGYKDSTHPGTMVTGALKTITINNSTKSSTSKNTEIGFDMEPSGVNNIGYADTVLDTYINGDNDGDGYYYDNDENGNLTIYRISDFTRTMQGLGTSSDPYRITNYNQLKEAAFDTTKYYRLDADIDMTNKSSIMLSSSENTFTGTFDGNTHTVSGINLIGYRYIGLFGYNSGTIKGLKATGNVSGFMNLGVLAGENNGTITTVIAQGNVSGYKQVGVILGVNVGENAAVDGVASGNLSTTVTCGNDIAYAGGVTGYLHSGTAKGLYLSGAITKVDCYGNGRTIGYKPGGTGSTGASNTITLNGNTYSDSNISSQYGKSYSSADLQTLTPYQEVELNTSSTSGEYRYALDSNYNPYIVKN